MIKTYTWRRLDFPGLEILHLTEEERGFTARSTIIDGGDGHFSLEAVWSLTQNWYSRSLDLTLRTGAGVKTLRIERGGSGWLVDDKPRPDLIGCLEIDVSATPFCNGLALHNLRHKPSEFDALYVDASDLSMQPSRQRYEKLGSQQWRYVDLGVADGFTAVLDFDEDGMVTHYEGLFERV